MPPRGLALGHPASRRRRSFMAQLKEDISRHLRRSEPALGGRTSYWQAASGRPYYKKHTARAKSPSVGWEGMRWAYRPVISSMSWNSRPNTSSRRHRECYSAICNPFHIQLLEPIVVKACLFVIVPAAFEGNCILGHPRESLRQMIPSSRRSFLVRSDYFESGVGLEMLADVWPASAFEIVGGFTFAVLASPNGLTLCVADNLVPSQGRMVSYFRLVLFVLTCEVIDSVKDVPSPSESRGR
jgi:hypothetical protein